MTEPIVVAGKPCEFIESAFGLHYIRAPLSGLVLYTDGVWRGPDGRYEKDWVWPTEALARTFAAACAAREAAQEPPAAQVNQGCEASEEKDVP
jgi:hypothetical protein